MGERIIIEVTCDRCDGAPQTVQQFKNHVEIHREMDELAEASNPGAKEKGKKWIDMMEAQVKRISAMGLWS